MDAHDVLPPDLRREHFAALNVLRRTKNLVLWLVILAAGLHAASWYVVRHTTLLRPVAAVDDQLSENPNAANQARRIRLAIETGLPLAAFAGRAAATLLAALCALSLVVSLSGQLGGAAGMARACVWSLAGLTLLIPWERLAAPEGVANLSSAFYDAYALFDLNAAAPDAPRFALREAARFAGYPLLAASLLLIAQACYRKAHREIMARAPGRMPMIDL